MLISDLKPKIEVFDDDGNAIKEPQLPQKADVSWLDEDRINKYADQILEALSLHKFFIVDKIKDPVHYALIKKWLLESIHGATLLQLLIQGEIMIRVNTEKNVVEFVQADK